MLLLLQSERGLGKAIAFVASAVTVRLVQGAHQVSLDGLFGVTVDSTNLTHILRAVMGLYFGMIVIWLWSAFSSSMAVPALVSCAVFMLGLAAGLGLSLVLDGMPHWLLVVYAVVEVVLGAIAIVLYRIHISTDASGAKR
ncbi:MAG: DUF4345 family protein [Caldilinea sp.]